MRIARPLLAAFLLFLCEGAHAQAAGAYPRKPVRFIAPFPPGGTSDVLCRLLGQKLAERLGQPVLVENKPGASSNIGHELVARQPADGYTILLSNNGALVINPFLFKRLGFDPVSDFSPVSMVASAGQVLVVHPSVPVASVRELIALAKAKPGELHYGSGGKGIPSHITAETFKAATGVDIVHVPYKGTVQAVTDLVGGQVELVFSDMVPAMPHIRAGKLRALGVTTAERSPALPDVPTIDDAGVPGFRALVWWAVLAPRATPPAVIDRLNAELGRIVGESEVQDKYASLGVATEHSAPQQVLARMQADARAFAPVLKAARMEPE
ncbi:MAG: tripartite tricarboxylate transporter substrate binding protein [Betaproteobacteria bacterium]|nr:tripartite tricarboxylate transporter substrate binding protein [Betaproteobacteria bacterium]